ncbi:glycosyl transferase [Salipaludibacillus neizhouensis]|uniref:Glycosyl transferase n=1 Tax=Salipaludibacillus neizhouensis TaxID=885475 RepID=A0A3A9K6V2_9BACI|nr:glycosyltransferase [Salipaludibacillus neizhouensis]RKL68297.1 glycosyl transferase [Salipaludibacillus neizhouensis]
MGKVRKVVHLTTVHHPLDPRIFYKECSSLDKAGYDVTLIAPESPDLQLERQNEISILPLKKYKNRFVSMVFSTIEAYKKAKKLNADFYHFHDPELLPVAWLLKKKSNVVVYDIHEDYETGIVTRSYLNRPLRVFISKCYKLIEKLLSGNMELCLAEKYYQEKYPRGKCILNYPLLNPELLKNDELNEDFENKLLYTGNLTKDRGALLHASLPKVDEKVSVFLFGRCSKGLAEEMFQVAGEKQTQLFVEGVDRYVPKQELDKSYVSQRWLAGLALFPPSDHYKKKELTKFFEYMTAGIPVLCSDFPVWKEFINKYQCGLTVNPQNESDIKEAIDFLRRNPMKAKEFGNNGRKAVLEELNWEKEEKKLLDWYSQIGSKNNV